MRRSSEDCDETGNDSIDVTDGVLERRRAESSAGAGDETVVALQKALLPSSLPVLPAVRTAARYMAAGRDQAAGGDWFDAIALGGGRLALVVGDMVGHGVAASAAMGQLRAVLAEALTRAADLETALQCADRFASRSADMRASTVCAAILDVRGGRIKYGTCGHPPPLVAGADGSSRRLPPSGGVPLGTGGRVRLASASIAAGDTVLLFSDGLVERTGHTLDEGMSALEEIVRDAVRGTAMPEGSPSSPAERVCRLAVELLSRPGFDDDITTLAAHVLETPQRPVRVEVPATSDGLLEARAQLRRWAEPLELSLEVHQGLDLATTETITNAIEHAYRKQEVGSVRVDAALGEDGVLEATVADEGLWDEHTEPTLTSGRGLWIAESVTDLLQVAHRGRPGDEGTRVLMRRALGRPPHLSVPEETASSRPRAERVELEIEHDEHDPSRLLLRGCADISSAEALAEQLERSSRGGFRDLTLDLSGLQLLASSAVRILTALRERHAAHGGDLILATAPGTPAQSVLDIVGLSWRALDDRDRPGDTRARSAPRGASPHGI